MSLKGSMYSGISGLQTHMMAMSVIGNNLANSSTLGFKGQRADFQDIFYSKINTGSGIGQIGHGSAVAQVQTNFSQGPYETTTSSTDVAIGGRGFFRVRDKNLAEQYYYTRAGNFIFNKAGVLTDPNGNIVQGWKARAGADGGKADAVGSMTDVRLDNFQSPPLATSKLSMRFNLDPKAKDKSQVAGSPFFSLFSQWNGTNKPPMASSKYSYQDTMRVYDANGGSHDLTIHFDRVGNPVASTAGGKINWEFTITIPPSEDGRIMGGTKLNTTSAAGMLMTGTLTFDANGKMSGMTAFTLASNASGNLRGLNNWVPAKFSDSGYPQIVANFTGQSNASFVGGQNVKPIEIDFGIRTKDTSGGGWSPGAPANAAGVGSVQNSLFNLKTPEIDSTATTSHDAASATQSKSQDGYTAGFLQSISINTDGVVTGRYSNGQVLDLYILALAKFNNENALQRLGSNLFSETRDSGAAVTGRANTGGLGKVNSNSLEQSNVDPGREMVRLITIQRGFQANSKVITTADSMLAELIQLKR